MQEAEAALREERDRAQAVLEVAGAILVVLDPGGRVLMLNQHGREVLEDPDGALVGQEWFLAAVPEDERAAMAEMFAQLTSGTGRALRPPRERRADALRRAPADRVAEHRAARPRGRDRGHAVLGPGPSPTGYGPRRRSGGSRSTIRSPSLPNRAQLDVRPARGGRPRPAPGPGRGAAVHRPRQLQARQRLARPRGRRPAAAPRRAAAGRLRGARRPARPPRRRRVPDPARRPRAGGGAEAAARAAADDVAVRLAKPFQIAGAEFHVEASVGISLFPGDADGPDTLLQHADAAMYQSKGRGRAASTVYARMTHDPLERLSLTSRLRRAIVERRAGAALPADRVDGERAAALDGGAAALERPRARARATPTASSRPPRR